MSPLWLGIEHMVDLDNSKYINHSKHTENEILTNKAAEMVCGLVRINS